MNNIFFVLIIFCLTTALFYFFQNKNDLEEIKYTIKEDKSMELNSDYIITRISWTKNGDNKLDYLLGVFEVANNPSFSDGIPIAMIKDQDFNQINYIDVKVPKFYKYLRYIPPLYRNETDITPIKLYGKSPSDINTNLVKDFQPTNLPLISIKTENSEEPVNKTTKINCEIVIINEGKTELKENATIKVRGRTTSIPLKKPYSIKFSSKQEVLGFEGSYKKWNLLANFFDISLIRNVLAFKVSELMEFEFTPRCSAVDLILNGAYRGNYYICDDIQIAKGRINMDEMKKKDITEPNISGGYFFEIDDGGLRFGYTNYETNKGIKWRIKEPDEDDITEEQRNYIIQKMNQFESESYSGNFTNMDLDSFSKFILVDEFCGDPDEVYNNFYISKKRNDDKFYFGPVWDFDLAFDNDKRLYPVNEKTNFLCGLGESAGTMVNFTDMLIKNKIIINHIKNTWEKVKTKLNESVLIDFIEQEENHIKESAQLNLFLWNNFIPVRNPFYRHAGILINNENREADLNELKEYVKKRFDSLTSVINQAASKAK